MATADSAAEGERGSVNPDGTITERRHSPPWTWMVVGLLVVMFSLMTVAIAVGASITHDIRRAIDKAAMATQKASEAAANANRATVRLDGAVRGSCVRLQAERERSNVVEATVYRVLRKAGYMAEARAAAWSPPANCERAVNSPTTYKPPQPVPFTNLPPGFAKRIIHAAEEHRRQPLP